MKKKLSKQIYTDQNFRLLIDSLKNIKDKTLQQKDLGEKYQQKIYDSLNDLENIYGYKPSYKNFINRMITPEIIKNAQDEIIKELTEKDMIGYMPELKILMQKIATQKNIDKTKNDYIEEFKLLNS